MVYVGASALGAWIGALLAAKSPVVKALIGIGTSICFADELFRRLSAIEAAQLEADGLTFVASSYGDGPIPLPEDYSMMLNRCLNWAEVST